MYVCMYNCNISNIFDLPFKFSMNRRKFGGKKTEKLSASVNLEELILKC